MSISLGVSRDLTPGAFLHSQSTQLLDQSLARDPEDARGAALVAAGETQHLRDVIRLDLRECRRGDLLVGGEPATRDLARQVLDLELATVLEQHRALEQVAQ